MPIFRCDKCGCVENTATSRYWMRHDELATSVTKGKALCSECHPSTKKWHGHFAKESAAGYLIGNDGFLYEELQQRMGTLPKYPGFVIVGKCP